MQENEQTPEPIDEPAEDAAAPAASAEELRDAIAGAVGHEPDDAPEPGDDAEFDDDDDALAPQLAVVQDPEASDEDETPGLPDVVPDEDDAPEEQEEDQDEDESAAALDDDTPAEAPVRPRSIMEAMLFVGGDPIPVAQIAELIGSISEDDVSEMVEELNESYAEDDVPLEIVQQKKGLAIQVTDQYLPVMRRLFVRRKQAGLSKAALEVLALVAYRQPINRQEIDNIRGSGSGGLLRTLIGRGLLRVVGRSEDGGRSVQYGTTQEFLDQFSLNDIDDLPRVADIERL